MRVILKITRFEGEEYFLEYHGVRNISHKGGAYQLDLYKDYQGPCTELLQQFNISSIPWLHCIYAEECYVSQEDRNQEQFHEDGEDLEDPVGYL